MVVKIILTGKLRRLISEAISSEKLEQNLRNELAKYYVENEEEKDPSRSDVSASIPFKTVRRFHDHLQKNGQEVYLNELISGTEVYVEPLKQPERNPELVKRLERLKKEQDQRKYNEMVSNVDAKYKDSKPESFATEIKAATRQLSWIVNFIISVAAAFFFGYFCTQFAFPDFGARILTELS